MTTFPPTICSDPPPLNALGGPKGKSGIVCPDSYTFRGGAGIGVLVGPAVAVLLGAEADSAELVEGPTPVGIVAGYNVALERIVTFETARDTKTKAVHVEGDAANLLLCRASLTADCTVMLHGQNNVGLRATAAGVTTPFTRLQPHAIPAIPQDYRRWFRDRRRRWGRIRRGGCFLHYRLNSGSRLRLPRGSRRGGLLLRVFACYQEHRQYGGKR